MRQVNLRGLQLAQLRGSLHWQEWIDATQEQRDAARIRLEGANLSRTHLESADLREVHLEDANLCRAYLEEVDFREAHLEKTRWNFAHLTETHLRAAHLGGCDLSEAYFVRTRLQDIIMIDEKSVGPRLVDAHWTDTNLAVVNWSQMKMLAEEYEARQKKCDGQAKSREARLREYEQAVRANRQLATVLEEQGLNEDAARFAYRAQKLQCIVLCQQRKFGQYLFNLFLDLLAGYGYRPGRSLLIYLVAIFSFAITYQTLGHLPLVPDSFVFSLTSFHGRGFFPGVGNEASLHNPLVVLAAIEAVVGLLIEISFIAHSHKDSSVSKYYR